MSEELSKKDICKISTFNETNTNTSKSDFYSFFRKFHFKKKENRKAAKNRYIREIEERNAYLQIRCDELINERNYQKAKNNFLHRRLSLLYEFFYE